MDSQELSKVRAFLSEKIVFDTGVRPAILVVNDGKIQEIIDGAGEREIQYVSENYPGATVEDFRSSVLMAGIVDSHVHVNEPGRTEWEGFATATRAAAAGGVTTIIDMPLNSIPPTTTLNHLKIKAKAARGRTHVDVGFWGGVIPGNQQELRPLINAGVVGFKCFLCPSGVEEFPRVNASDVEKALAEIKSTGSLLAFHAEYETKNDQPGPEGDHALYETFLHTRPPEMEMNAIAMICKWCKASDVRCHIVHLSAATALDLIRETKNSGAPLTVETCHHYLILSAETVPNGATEFKCCPPIRDKDNQDKLWNGLTNGVLDMVVSDHSPCVKELKTCGDFITAWGGISSLQFGLPLFWTASRTRNIQLPEVSNLLSLQPAKICGLSDRKGALKVGMDADFVIWNPEAEFKITEDHILYKNKLSPYMGKLLQGQVVATVLRGEYVFKNGKLADKPIGNLLLKGLSD